MADKQAWFEALVRSYSDDLYRMALWLCRNPALADDLTQETFLRAWRAMHQLRDEKAAKGWLITILRREHARVYERKALDLVDADEMDILDDSSPGPSTSAEIRLLRQAMARLAPKYREPLVLQVLGGYSCQEIADELNLGSSAVMTRLFRARRQLKTMLDQDSGDQNVNDLP